VSNKAAEVQDLDPPELRSVAALERIAKALESIVYLLRVHAPAPLSEDERHYPDSGVPSRWR
jgi:hypothetical protein